MKDILILVEQQRWREAERRCRAALTRDAVNPQLLQLLGTALLMQGDAEAALGPLEAALGRRPGLAGALNARGLALEKVGRFTEAVAAYRQLVAVTPVAAAWFNLGNACRRAGDAAAALQAYGQACARAPKDLRALSALVRMKQELCDWERFDELARRLIEGAERSGQALDPFRLLTLADDEAVQQRNARRWTARFGTARPRPRPAAKARIALGYLSADLQRHATAYLMAELFELHDRQRFSVTAYSLGADDGSAERRRLVQGFDRFVDCAGLPAETVARRIEEDGIDILIDLKGYTRGASPGILAARPAPVQVQWIGFPGTMGAGFVDYLIADRVVLPDPALRFYDECVVRLPGSYQVNDRKRPRPAAAPPPEAFGLPEGGPVVACFNSPNKLTPEVFALWMRLLAEVGDATLWLLCDQAEAGAKLRAAAQAHGVDGSRLVFATKLPLEEHLARYRHVDLFLDTLPYNAHTTASDALWMGCPLVTRTGNSFAGRVAASLLKAVGLERYVTLGPDDYEAVALRLLRTPEERAAVRAHLGGGPEALPLFDTVRSTAAVERAYEIMWSRALAGLAPQSFDL